MQLPQLSDFGLSEQSIFIHESQKKKYYDICNRVSEERRKRNKIVNWASAIPTIILIIIVMPLWYRLNNFEEGSTALVLFLLGMAIGYPIIIRKLFYISDYAMSNYEKQKEKRFEENLGFKCQKNAYIDESIENKLIKYNQALEKYKDLTEKSRVIYWQKISPYQFEKETAELYNKLGYSTRVTKGSGDGGIDIIMSKEGKRIGVQCKHHSKPVAPNDFRALIGVIASQGFDYGIFVSLNGFTATVQNEARMSRIRIDLVSCNDLCTLAKTIK